MTHKPDDKPNGNWKSTVLTSLVILLVALGLTWLVFSTQPKAIRVGASKTTAMLVEATPIEHGTFRPIIQALGTVRPSKDIILRPRVSGEVTHIAADFAPGGLVEKGQKLLQIDPADYQTSLEQHRAALRQAQAEVKIEMGRQDAALRSYQLLDEKIPADKVSLVLRQPQLDALKARAESAQAAVEQAQRDLVRTTIRAPFKAQILDHQVNLGSQVSVGENLGRLVGRQVYWVETRVPQSLLQWLSFNDQTGTGAATVQIRSRTAWPEGIYRSGTLYKLIGALEEKTRMASVLVTIEDPLALTPESKGAPQLMIGAFVETRIQAKPISDAYRIDLAHLRRNDSVWIMHNNKLDIRNVQVVFRDATHAYIRQGLKPEEQLVTTNLATVVQGASLRLKGTAQNQDQQTQLSSEN